MEEPEKQLFAEMIRGAKLIFENATALYDEAQLLGSKGAFARALTLHQISMEECSKVEMLGASATSLLMGNPIDLDKLATKFRQHQVKNHSNAYLSVKTDAEAEARKRGDVAGAVQIFKAQQADIHRMLNTNKNASLYVDYRDGMFISPAEQITEEMAAHIQQVNGFFLRHGSNNLEVLNKMANDPEAFAAQATDFTGRLEQLMEAEAVDLEEKFHEMVGAWLEEEVEKAKRVAETPSEPSSSSS
jgi:AbiV family abortive infection protein